MTDAETKAGVRRAVILFAIGLALVIAAAIMILSFASPRAARQDPQTEDAYVGGDVTPLSPRVQGYLKRLPIADNQAIHAGDLVAQIEDDDYRARVSQAEAQVAAAQARLEALDAQLRQNTQQTAQARTSEVAAIADTGTAVPELRRQQRLMRTDLGLQRNLERAQAEQARSAADVQAARAMVLVQQRRMDALADQRRQQAATLLGQEASLDLARINLGWTRLVAPFDGTLGIRLVRVGDLLNVGSRVVVLTPLDSVWVDANFTERQISDIRIGQSARLVLDAFPGRPLDGHVAGIAPLTGSVLSAVPPDNATGNFTKVVQRIPVRIAIDWHGSSLRGLVRPGMSAIATVFTGSATAGRPGDAPRDLR